MHHLLSDGARIGLRPVEPADKARLTVALGRLSDETVRRRFLAAKLRFSSDELRYLTEVDGHDHLAIVAVLADDPETIVGVARCVRLLEAPVTAEFAIVVADDLQGRGLGTRLARTLADAARAEGIHRFAATMLGENVAVRQLMSTITGELERDRVDGGLREVVIDIAA
ncbi:MAG TPA: GNAT family N-acetyltransferase [Solirubrobacteraceae bacterium]|nr:GNAT family N-acetyltransferase [Solirubrobacteraceae bacterium]